MEHLFCNKRIGALILCLTMPMTMSACAPTHEAKEPLISEEGSIAAPGCPDWTETHMANYSNTLLSNFGCSHANNMVQMIEDPNDLIAPQGDARADAVRSVEVMRDYRGGPAPADSSTAAESGSSADNASQEAAAVEALTNMMANMPQ